MAKKSNKPMLDKIKEFYNNNKIWIALILLVCALFVFNYILFQIYENANPNPSFWVLLWNFLSSDGFKVVTISFLLPIFLLVAEIIFKVKERDDAKIAEEQKKRKEDQKKEQLDCISQTQMFWKEIVCLANQVKYDDGNHSIDDFLLKLKKHTVEAEEVLNNSYITFQKISKKSIENEELYNLIKSQKFYHIISVPAYILLESTNTVVHFIRDHPDDKRIEHYQLLLSIIEKNIRKIFYGSILAVFKNLMILEHENYDQKIETRLNTYLTNLYCWTGCLKLIEIQYNKIFWFLNDDKDIKPNGIQNSSDEFEKWLKNDHDNTKNPKLVWKYQELDKFHDLYNEIKLKNFENTYSLNHYYYIKYLEELAKNLDFMRLCFDINDRAYWKIISTNCLRSNKTS